MNRSLHPRGAHILKLTNVYKSKFDPNEVSCVFSGTGKNRDVFTIMRKVQVFGRFAANSKIFFDQLEGFQATEDLYSEVSRFIGQEFICVVGGPSKNNQMNIEHFLAKPNNSLNHQEIA